LEVPAALTILRRMLKVITLSVTLASGALLANSRIATGAEGKCTVATQGDSPVARACSRGGRAEAKKVMKEAVRAAKDRGGKFNCDDCHKDADSGNFELKPNARDDFKKLLEVAGAATPPTPGK
jgi:hypothetical protein